MATKLDSLADVRAELSEVYSLAKANMILMQRAKDLSILLKTIASVIKDEKEMDVEAELTAIREQINQLKGEQNNG